MTFHQNRQARLSGNKITEIVKKLKPLKLNLEESFCQLIKVENTAL
jgi:hypothetical protein